MIRPRPQGTAPFVLSVLDNAITGEGHTAQESFAGVIDLARTADRRGYERFWMSEHHAMPGASTSSPQLMVARLIGETERIRLGAGGIMLPNHVPLVIAEQFGMLEALAPGRIDLGLGRAPGTDGATAAALRRHQGANEQFPDQVDELFAFLEDTHPPEHPYGRVHAVPGPWQSEQNHVTGSDSLPQIWILGSSVYSAQLAARLGRPYAFALQFGSADVVSAMQIYREQFRPSVVLAEPYSLLSIGTIALDDPAEARRQASTSAMGMMRMFLGQGFSIPHPDDVERMASGVREGHFIREWTDRTLHGTAADVAHGLEAVHQHTQVDEVMLVTGGHSREVHTRTLELIADHYSLPED